MQLTLLSASRTFLYLNLAFLAPLLLFGLMFSCLKKHTTHYLNHTLGFPGTVFFGLIGVPLHECSHLLLCLLFGHRVLEVRFFRPFQSKEDNILGYVRHTYNRSSFYQSVGCFFIGIAPMLMGSACIVLLLLYGFPKEQALLLPVYSLEQLSLKNLTDTFRSLLHFLSSLFMNQKSVSSWRFWLVLYCIVSITLHMTISTADFKNALKGFLLLEGFFYPLTFFLIFIPHLKLLPWSFQISSFLWTVLILSSFIFLIVSFLSFLLYLLFGLFRIRAR